MTTQICWQCSITGQPSCGPHLYQSAAPGPPQRRLFMHKQIRFLMAAAMLALTMLCGGIKTLAQDDSDPNEKVYRLPGSKTCAPALSRSRIEVPASGGNFSVRVTLPGTCNSAVTYWTDSFISTPSPQDTRGSATINFRVAANDSGRRRSGKILITGIAGTKKRNAYVYIKQEGNG